MVMPSGPGAPPFAFTFFQAISRLASSTTASIKDIGNKLKAGCSARAAAVRPGRDSEPVVSGPAPPDRFRAACPEGFPRCELADGSSLFFIVRSFPSRLVFEDRYYDLG
jgi:hypothetical protein